MSGGHHSLNLGQICPVHERVKYENKSIGVVNLTFGHIFFLTGEYNEVCIDVKPLKPIPCEL